jgi:serine protease Do
MKRAPFRKMSRDRLIALASAAAIFAAGALAYAFVGPLSAQNNNTPKPVQLVPPGGAKPLPAMITPSSMSQVQLTFAPVVKKVMPAVVNVYARSVVQQRVNPLFSDPFFSQFFGGTPEMRQRVQQSLGSGVIVRPDGIILTNNHVVAGDTDIVVALSDKREFKAKVLTADPHTDLAVLKIDTKGEKLPTVPFADSDRVQVGDLVLAVGDPFGVGQTVTMGIVSALARTQIGDSDYQFFIQTDAAINPGNSGGALVDMDGDLVGINSAIYSRSGGSIGIGFAIPSDMVRTVVAQAVAGSKSVARPWIGIASQDVTPEIASSLGLASPHGALVTRVDKDSPGEKAGIKVGDLILKAGDRDIGDSGALDYRLAVAGIGKDIPLTVWRDGASKVIDVTTAAEPELSKSDLTQISGRGPLSGAVVADLTAALADRMNIRGTTSGAVIVDVKPGSPAEQVGFAKGDVVLGAQGRTVTTGKQLADIVGKDSRYWRITFSRDGQISNVILGG